MFKVKIGWCLKEQNLNLIVSSKCFAAISQLSKSQVQSYSYKVVENACFQNCEFKHPSSMPRQCREGFREFWKWEFRLYHDWGLGTCLSTRGSSVRIPLRPRLEGSQCHPPPQGGTGYVEIDDIPPPPRLVLHWAGRGLIIIKNYIMILYISPLT